MLECVFIVYWIVFASVGLITSGSIRCTLLQRSECCVPVYLQQMQPEVVLL